MGIAIDIILVLILIFFIWQSARRGFVRTIIDVLGYVLAMFVAFSLSGTVATLAYDNLVKPAVISSVQQEIEENSGNEVGAVIENIFDTLPASLVKAAENIGITKDEAIEEYNNAIEGGASKAAAAVTDSVVGPVIVNIFRTIALLIISITLISIIKVISKTLSGIVSKIPLIGWANRALGAVVGVFKGGLVALLIAVLLVIILPLIQNGGEIIESSYILKYIMTMNVVSI